MPTCPLCLARKAKRYCPAKEAQICPVCCGTKREIEIDCPSDCIHLRSGRLYEAEKRSPDPELVARVRELDRDSVQQLVSVLEGATGVVVEEHLSSRWLVDNDVLEVYKSLDATLKTLSSGIYYETLPEGSVRVSLYRRLKTYLEELMQPQQGSQRRALRITEALQVMDVLTLAAQLHAGTRPRSRQYLDWLTGMSTAMDRPEQTSGLILP